MKINLLLLSFFLLPHVGKACSCASASIQKDFAHAAYVVEAQVMSLADTVHYDLYSNPIHPPFQKGHIPQLQINRGYKGKLKVGESVVVTGDDSMCSYYFTLGQTYLVFLFKDADNRFRTSTCVKNALTSDKEVVAEARRLSRQRN